MDKYAVAVASQTYMNQTTVCMAYSSAIWCVPRLFYITIFPGLQSQPICIYDRSAGFLQWTVYKFDLPPEPNLTCNLVAVTSQTYINYIYKLDNCLYALFLGYLGRSSVIVRYHFSRTAKSGDLYLTSVDFSAISEFRDCLQYCFIRGRKCKQRYLLPSYRVGLTQGKT